MAAPPHFYKIIASSQQPEAALRLTKNAKQAHFPLFPSLFPLKAILRLTKTHKKTERINALLLPLSRLIIDNRCAAAFSCSYLDGIGELGDENFPVAHVSGTANAANRINE